MNKVVYTIIIAGLSLLVYGCGGGSLTGTEVGNPAIIAGKVQDSVQQGLGGASVYLVTPDYNAALDSTHLEKSKDTNTLIDEIMSEDEEQCILVKADSEGRFVIRGAQRRIYNLYIVDYLQKRIAFHRDVKVTKDSSNVGAIQVKAARFASINVSDTVFHGSGYISMPGTPIKIPADTSGVYTIPLVGDSLRVLYCDKSSNMSSTILDKKIPVSATPEDTVDLTGIEHILVPPSPAIIINGTMLFSSVNLTFKDSAYFTIIASGAYSNKSHALEYQFYETNRDVSSDWDTLNTYQLYVTYSGSYQVSCRARSRSDKAVITSWSPVLTLVVSKWDTSFAITRPLKPVLRGSLDSTTVLDSLPARIYVGPSISSDSIPLSYRISWSDSSRMVSNWSRDTLFKVEFNMYGSHYVCTQARSSIDTTKVSEWSDSLFVNMIH